jgi:hypothetical protein
MREKDSGLRIKRCVHLSCLSVLSPESFPLVILCTLLLPAAATAAIAAGWSLPLNGYYRIGRYMPVRFEAGAKEFRISADGMVETVVPDPAGGIAPCYLSRSASPDVPLFSALHELRPSDRLVGIATNAGNAAREIFAGDTVLTVPLDAAHPLPGPPAAWQTLDAVVLDASAASDLGDERINVLLSGGTTLAVPSDSARPPAPHWPWKLEHGLWLLPAPSPLIVPADDENFAPVSGWQAGRSARDRRQVMWMGVLWAVLVLLVPVVCHRHPVHAALTVAMIAVLACLGISIWDLAQSPTSQAIGFVYCIGEPSVKDTWIFKRATRACGDSTEFGDNSIPILAMHGGPDEMRILCNRTGHPMEFQYKLWADRAAGFVSRNLADAPPIDAVANPLTTPLRLLPMSLYSGLSPLGEVRVPAESEMTQWPTLFLANSDAMPKNVTPLGRDSSNK